MFLPELLSTILPRSCARVLPIGAFGLILFATGFGATDLSAGGFTCDYDSRVQVGTIQANQSPYLNEASGLVQSRRQPNVFWSHQDNAEDDRIFAIRDDGTYLGTWDLDVWWARDPEDIAIGPGPIQGQDYIYLGDIGHNNGVWGSSNQRNLKVYRAMEPAVDPNQPFVTVPDYPADTIRLAFPDEQMVGQRQDVEALMVDPLTGDIYVATKRSNPGMVFRAPFPHSTTETVVMEWVADLPFGGYSQATGGDISADGRMIIIRRYSDAFIWERPDAMSVADAVGGDYCYLTGLGETQGEAIAFNVDNSGSFYTLSEGGGQVPLWFYEAVSSGCLDDAECDDGSFCSGVETCDTNGDCQPGQPPICPGQVCSDALGACADCTVSADCRDGSFCNGEEACNSSGQCEFEDPPACPGQECNDSVGACVDCVVDVDCDDGEICNSDTGQCEQLLFAQPLPIETDDPWSYFVGTSEPPPDWAAIQFDDSLWPTGSGGFGYGADCNSQHGTTLSEMIGASTSVYMRKPFILEDPDTVGALTLTIDYDDGFVAYLNGQEVARRNVAGSPPSFTQPATQGHECSGGDPNPSPAETILISSALLVPGVNVLALQGHNRSSTSSDFSLIISLATDLRRDARRDRIVELRQAVEGRELLRRPRSGR